MELRGNVEKIVDVVKELEKRENADFQIVLLDKEIASRFVEDAAARGTMYSWLDRNYNELLKKTGINYIRMINFGKVFFDMRSVSQKTHLLTMGNIEIHAMPKKYMNEEIFKQYPFWKKEEDPIKYVSENYWVERYLQGVFSRVKIDFDKTILNRTGVLPVEVKNMVMEKLFEDKKVWDGLFLTQMDLLSYEQAYGNKEAIDLVIQTPANRITVGTEIINMIVEYAKDLEMSHENQQKIVKVLNKTKAISSSDLGGKITLVAAKLDDIYFEKILPNFPTLRAQVEDLDVADKIVENIEKEEYFTFLWMSQSMFNDVNVDKASIKGLTNARKAIVDTTAQLCHHKVKHFHTMDIGSEWFIITQKDSETTKLVTNEEFRETLKFVINQFLVSPEIREMISGVRDACNLKVSSQDVGKVVQKIDIMISDVKMREDLQKHNELSGEKVQSMVKLKKF